MTPSRSAAVCSRLTDPFSSTGAAAVPDARVAGVPERTDVENPQSGPGTAADQLPESLAAKRGKNWALPNAAARLIAVRRPIRIDLFADRVVLVPEQGLAGGRSIAMQQPAEKVIDQLVFSIWNYIEQWGSAGSGMYWRPVLRVRVAPGAEQQFIRLQRLLDHSGLLVERSQ